MAVFELADRAERSRSGHLRWKWRIWLHQNDNALASTERLAILTSFDKLQEFWRVFKQITPVVCCDGYEYCIFKENCLPDRAHPMNKGGGRWILELNHCEASQLFNFYWLKILFSLVLDRYGSKSSEICGAQVAARRRGCRLSLWIKSGVDLESIFEIGDYMRRCLSITEDKVFYYETHLYAMDRIEQSRNPRPDCSYIKNLKYKWKLLLCQSNDDGTRTGRFTHLAVFETLPQFWAISEKFRKPSRLGTGFNYYLFKMDIDPNWIDRENRNAGRWVIEVNRENSYIDFYWLTLLLSLLLDRFGESGTGICGAVIQVQSKKCELSLWSEHEDAEEILKLGGTLKKEFDSMVDDCALRYETQEIFKARKHSTVERSQLVVYSEEGSRYRYDLYLFEPNESVSWQSRFTTIASFNNLQTFWKIYNGAAKPSFGSDYYCFKEGVRPNWDDPNNINGGRWAVDLSFHEASALLDYFWLALLLALVLNRFGDLSDYICGAVVRMRRKGCKVSLWTTDTLNFHTLLRIGEIMKAELSITDDRTLYYEKHESARMRTDSRVFPLLSIPFVQEL